VDTLSERKILNLGLSMAMAVILMLALACSSDSEPETVSVKLALDWYPNSNHLGLYIAQEKGYFADENLEVEIYTPVDPSTVLQTVGAGADDFGISYQPDVLMARAQGVPVVSVAGMVQHPLNSVMALKSSGIERPSDLVGKKVGYPGLPTDEPLLETMLKFDGANGLGDVELVRVGFNLTESLISGTVDAVVGAYWTHESILLENLGQPVNILKVQDWGVPDYYELVLVVSEKYIEEHSDVIERFTRALSKGFADAIADPQAGVNTLIAASNEEVDRAIEGPGADLLVPLWKTSESNFGGQTTARWVDFAAWMQETGLLSEEVDASKAFTDKFIK
jgi:putative hydroxymethylpyrimidine transport system substrate-binding protein